MPHGEYGAFGWRGGGGDRRQQSHCFDVQCVPPAVVDGTRGTSRDATPDARSHRSPTGQEAWHRPPWAGRANGVTPNTRGSVWRPRRWVARHARRHRPAPRVVRDHPGLRGCRVRARDRWRARIRWAPMGRPAAADSAEVDAAAVRLTQAWRGQRSLLEIRGLEAVHADARPHAAATLCLDGALVLRRQRLDATRHWFGEGFLGLAREGPSGMAAAPLRTRWTVAVPHPPRGSELPAQCGVDLAARAGVVGPGDDIGQPVVVYVSHVQTGAELVVGGGAQQLQVRVIGRDRAGGEGRRRPPSRCRRPRTWSGNARP